MRMLVMPVNYRQVAVDAIVGFVLGLVLVGGVLFTLH
jgi:hypothetical protein